MTIYRCQTVLILLVLISTGCRAVDRVSRWQGRTSQGFGHSINVAAKTGFVTNSDATSDNSASPKVKLAGYEEVRPAPGKTHWILPATHPSETTEYGLIQSGGVGETSASESFHLSLEDAIGLALERNPDLVAIRAGEPVATAAIRVAKTYPYNPQVQTQILPYSRDTNGEDGAVSQQHVLVQTYELGGQQRHREAMASANWRQVDGTIHQAELANTAQTERLFFAALYQRELRDLSQSLAGMNEQLVGVMERRETAGQSNKADVELAKLQSKATQRQLRLTEANYQTSLLSLQNHLNVDQQATVNLKGQWTHWQWASFEDRVGIDPASLLEGAAPVAIDSRDDATLRQLVKNRPDLAAARSAVAMATENLRLANAMRRPSLQAGPMYQRDNSSTTFWGVQAQFDLPVVNTGGPLVRQRCAELHQQQAIALQLENRAVLEARAAILRYERARRFVEESRAEFDRDLSHSLQPFEEQFKAGQITLLQVLAAGTTIALSQQSFFDLLNELSQAAAEVTQATGVSPQQLITMAP